MEAKIPPQCEALRFGDQGLRSCREPARKRISISDTQNALLCAECCELWKRKSSSVEVAFTNDEQRGRSNIYSTAYMPRR